MSTTNLSPNDLLKKIQSFSETYQEAYTHGLENIYTLEKVDLTSIRRIEEQIVDKSIVPNVVSDCQEQFDFGEEWRDWIPPIGSKEGRCHRVDFASWIRLLFDQLPPAKAFVALEAYGLENLVRLSSKEKFDVQRLSVQSRQDWIEEILMDLQQSQRRNVYQTWMTHICNAFIKPWVARRQGIALEWELNERLARLSEDSSIAGCAMKFFQEVYEEGECPMSSFMIEEKGVYFSDSFAADRYCALIQKAKTYFYNPSIVYTLSNLVSLISREFALKWEGFPEGFMEKALRYSPIFRVRKAMSGHLEVRLR